MIKASQKSASTLGKRLKFEMKSRGLTSAELSKRAGVKTSFLYDVLSGKSAHPSTITLAKVAETLGVDLADLVGGEQPSAHTTPRFKQDDYITIPHVMVDSAKEGKLATVLPESTPCIFRKSWIQGQLGAESADLRMFLFRGDSMQPTLMHADTLLIDISRTRPSPPGLFLIFDGTGLVVKRLEYTSPAQARLRVMSDNSKYSAYECAAQDALIVGAVIWFGRGI